MGKRIQQEPNYQLLFNSAICALQQKYNEYKKAIIKNIEFTWIGNDGEYCFLEGVEERNKKIDELKKEIIRLRFKVDELKEMNTIKSNNDANIVMQESEDKK